MIDAVSLSDGRSLAYRGYGPPDGTPVLFIPGAGCGRLMSFGDDLLADFGVRLISVDRPGLGASTHDPHKSFATVADDLTTLIDTLVGEPVAVVANSQGAPFGLALAATDFTRSLALVSPIDDVGHPPTTAQLPEHYRTLLDEVAADPAAAAAELSRYTSASMFDMLLADYPPADAAVYDRPDFQARLRAALDDGFSCGANGYALDTVLAMTAWPTDLFAPRAPVRVWFGARDRVHSPDLGATLTARVPGARRHVVDDAGGALLWARPELVLAAL